MFKRNIESSMPGFVRPCLTVQGIEPAAPSMVRFITGHCTHSAIVSFNRCFAIE